MRIDFRLTGVAAMSLLLPATAFGFDGPLGLPLQQGYYIAEGSSCAEANDSNLAMVHAAGINTPELLCEFEQVISEREGRYTFAGTCAHVEQRLDYLNEGRIAVSPPDSFMFNDGVVQGSFNYCAPETLPAPFGTTG